jgi:hypothetical protein
MNPMLTAARASAETAHTNVIVLERRVAWNDSEAVAQRLAAERRWPVMVYFSGGPGCPESEAFESSVVADPRVAAFIAGTSCRCGCAAAAPRPAPLRRDAHARRARHRLHGHDLRAHRRPLLGRRVPSAAGARGDDFECAQPEPPGPPRPSQSSPRPSSESDEELVAQSLHWQAASRFRRTGDTQRLFADWRAIAKALPAQRVGRCAGASWTRRAGELTSAGGRYNRGRCDLAHAGPRRWRPSCSSRRPSPAAVGRIPQNPAYHGLADRRTLLGVPNALDVLSNLPFVVVGALGLAVVRRGGGANGVATFADPWERWPAAALFLGTLLTAFGSSWYHLAPDSARLLWDGCRCRWPSLACSPRSSPSG